MTSRPNRASGKIRSGASAGRTILALVVVLVIFLALAIYIVVNPGAGGHASRLMDDAAVREDVEAARREFPNVGGTAAEHVREGERLAAEGTSAAALRAYDEFRKALALEPETPEALLGIAAIYRYLDREGVDFRVERALTYCDAVAEVYPNDPRPFRVKAKISMDLKGYEAGVEAWTRVLVLYPDDQEAMTELGRCLMELGRHAEAATQLEKAVAVATDQTEPLLLLAENNRRGREYGAAHAALARIPDQGRSGARAAVAMARIAEEVGHDAMAREQVRQALRLDGNLSEALLLDAIYRYQDDGDLEGARENLLRILNQPDIDWEPELRDRAALHLGAVYRLDGDLGRAHDYLDPLVARRPRDLPARYHAAKVSLAENRGAEQAGELNLLLTEERCTVPEMWFLLGQLRIQEENLEGTIGAFERAIELDSSFHPAYYSLIHILGEYGNYDDIRHLVRALYHDLERRDLLRPPRREYHDAFDLSALEGSLLQISDRLETLNPTTQEHLELSALVYYDQGRFDIARPMFESLSNRTEGDSIHQLYLGMMDLDEGNIAGAAEHFEDAREESRTEALYLYLAARMQEEQGRTTAAQQAYDRLMNYHRDHVLLYHGRARLAHRMGDEAGAAAAYRDAHRADPEFLPAWRDHLLLEMGQPLIPGVL